MDAPDPTFRDLPVEIYVPVQIRAERADPTTPEPETVKD
jgi:hypothetical protein